MRAYPFGLVFADDLERAEQWAVEHSKLTHRDPIALAACAAMAVGTALAVARATPDDVVVAMIAAARRHDTKTADMMKRALDEAREGVPPDVTLLRLQAWAAHEAIAAAVYIFARHPDDPRAAILEGANTDGDSDSIATLAGALVGGRCGIGAIPNDWVAQVERSAELLELAASTTRLFPVDRSDENLREPFTGCFTRGAQLRVHDASHAGTQGSRDPGRVLRRALSRRRRRLALPRVRDIGCLREERSYPSGVSPFALRRALLGARQQSGPGDSSGTIRIVLQANARVPWEMLMLRGVRAVHTPRTGAS
jgi:hypothetical protein